MKMKRKISPELQDYFLSLDLYLNDMKEHIDTVGDDGYSAYCIEHALRVLTEMNMRYNKK